MYATHFKSRSLVPSYPKPDSRSSIQVSRKLDASDSRKLILILLGTMSQKFKMVQLPNIDAATFMFVNLPQKSLEIVIKLYNMTLNL